MRAVPLALLGVAWSIQPGASHSAEPPLLQQIRGEARRQCEGDVAFGEGFVTGANFSPDGKPDYVLNYRHVTCQGRSSEYCGTGGCRTTVLVSDGHTYRRVFEEVLREYRIVPRPDGDAMSVRLHGTLCTRTATNPYEMSYRWRRGRFAAQD